MVNAHMTERAARAEKIIAGASSYKICEGCDSIVAARVATCPSCHGYRFNEDAGEVVIHARELASRPQTSVTPDDME